ncbi:hypothetical protein BDHH15_07470 [Bradyrhizobium diazoefficiens]|uniref:WCX domain-containing protein n=1 Tax=Bradyrhizobium diazoefficiens TaxID=1355477 RepID=A0A809Y6E6_9BRAD|nr:hypothetical protein H12S4_07520 [Bradyrhizobium diazoefficiens]BCA17532.1 hypothetical protein BDHH15_07470 [Bradyrhizobium diazoefficiens]BCE35716.1 hypothetical protein XF3B_07470 [Bradyrhizobium diazoefficiens]BCF49109.1 hypothetical protein XF17B_07470 [Bradyrhizobium diazoefficiens]
MQELQNQRLSAISWARPAASLSPRTRESRFGQPDERLYSRISALLLVGFRAGGALEMCWHLFTGGDQVKIIEPKHLRKLIRQELESGAGVEELGTGPENSTCPSL